MKVFDADSESCLNPLTASLAAKSGEKTLTANSVFMSSRENESRGSCAFRATLSAPANCVQYIYETISGDKSQELLPL
jgi:hypothetical protein